MRFRVKTGLIVGSLILIGLLSGTILTAQWLIGQKAADKVAHTLFETTAYKVESQVNNLIDIPLKMSGIIAFTSGIESPKDAGLNDPIRHQMFKTLEEHQSIYSVYIGHEDGSFYQVIAARGDAGVLSTHKAPDKTEWIVRTIFNDASNARQQSWSFLDKDQKLLQGHVEAAPSYDPRKRPWYELAKTKVGAALSDVYVFNSLQKPGITASHTLRDKSGVVGIDMTLSGLSQFMSDQKLSENSVIFIYDNKNRVIALPDKIKNVPLLSEVQKIPSEAVQSIFAETNTGDFYSDRLEIMKDGPGFKLGIVAPVSDFTETYRDMQQKIFFIVIACLVVFVPLVMYFSQRLAKRVKQLAEDAKRIQNKDFASVEKSATSVIEISELEHSFSDMRESLYAAEQIHQKQLQDQQAKIERQVQRDQHIIEFEKSMAIVFNGLDTANRSMKETAQEMQGIAHHTKEQSSSVAVSAEVTSTNVETVASAAEELSSSIGEIAYQSLQASESTLNAVNEATDTSEKISVLEDNVAKINEFVLMINEIAHQTNMLALNATIEAARAGTAGKGFAVVAGEVKALAHQTAQATEEIVKQIAMVQASTTASVEAINSVSNAIEEVKVISTSISAAIDQQRATTNEIARNAEQAAMETQNVSNEIKRLQETANRSETASNDIDTAAGGLSSQGDILRTTVTEFLQRVQSDRG